MYKRKVSDGVMLKNNRDLEKNHSKTLVTISSFGRSTFSDVQFENNSFLNHRFFVNDFFCCEYLRKTRGKRTYLKINGKIQINLI